MRFISATNYPATRDPTEGGETHMANAATERINRLGKQALKQGLSALYRQSRSEQGHALDQWNLWTSLNSQRKLMVKSWLGKGRTKSLDEALRKMDRRIKRDTHQL